MGAKVWFAFARAFAIHAVFLFGAAGTLRWPAGWAFMVLMFGGSLIIMAVLARHDPALLQERAKPLLQPGQPLWDRLLMIVFAALWLGWLVLMGLDAVRFAWSAVPVLLSWIGAAGIVVALWIWYRTFRVNTFASAAVRIQADRGHTVVSSGPYAVVRHPLYAGALIFFAAVPLLLGSWWGLAGGVALGAVLIVRTALEDRELQRDLNGYSDYAGRVRFKLIPLVW